MIIEPPDELADVDCGCGRVRRDVRTFAPAGPRTSAPDACLLLPKTTSLPSLPPLRLGF